jgi:hypothetical protein
MRKGVVNSPHDAAAGRQIWRAGVVRDGPPPPRAIDVTEGGMGGGGAIALLVPLSSTIV